MKPHVVKIAFLSIPALILFTVAIVSYRSETAGAAANPVGQWLFDEGAGTAVADSSGNNNNGVVENGAAWTSDSHGGALQFDGVDDRVRVTTSGSINDMTSLTVIGSIYPTRNNSVIFRKGELATARFNVLLDAEGTLNFRAPHSTSTGVWRTATPLTLNQWQQIAVSYSFGDVNNDPILYVNAVPQPLVEVTAPAGTPLADTPEILIGNSPVFNMGFGGQIYSLRVYNEELLATAIQELYTQESSPEPSTKPNVVVIMTDDQTPADMAVMPKTQNLIGSQGLTFSNSFTDFPLCCPSRASFLTGQAAHNSQVLGNQPGTGFSGQGGHARFKPTEGNALPVWLQQAGYVTAMMGKYLNGFVSTDSIPPGWTLWNGIADDQGGYKFYNYTINENGVLQTYGSAASDYKTDVQAQKAADFISNQTSGQPLFLWLNPLAPHFKSPETSGGSESPDPAPRHIGLFNTLPLPQPPNFNETVIADKPAFMRALPLLSTPTIDTITDQFRRRRESLLAVDDMVETVINSLQATGKLDNTYVIFTSDNGHFSGEHRRPRNKYVAYEESIRVPLLIRGPGIPAGQTRSQLVNNLDLVATIEELAGVSAGRVPDGRSLTPLFSSSPPAWRSSLLVQGLDGNNFPTPSSPGRFQAVRTEHYKYIEHLSDAGVSEKEFYDLAADPYELVSKPTDPAYAAVVTDLQAKLTSLRPCVGASCWLTSPEIPLTLITSPANNATVSGSVPIEVTLPNTQPISKVEFYVDGSLIQTVTAAPYRALWNTTSLAPNSSHTLVAKGYDAQNTVGSSATISVTVTDSTPPTVSITAPTNGSQVPRNTNVTIQATASDVSAISKVEFSVNGSLKCTDTSSPYTCVWRVPTGKNITYTLQAKAYDTVGNTQSATVQVTSK